MTEDEAKTKACCGPYMIAAIATADYSRTGANKPDTINWHCIGSACMAWQRLDPEVDTTYTLEDAPAPGPEWSKAGTIPYTKFTQKWTRPKSGRNGFCGLAGAPT